MRTHGLSKTKLYYVWRGMIARCRYPSFKYYSYYGGRGIKVCPEWESDFVAFQTWAMAHGYQAGLQIDRIDNNGDYSPVNCRWVTSTVNARNKRSTHAIPAFGETKSIAAWAEDPRCVVALHTLYARLTRFYWAPEEALTVSAGGRRSLPRPTRRKSHCKKGHPLVWNGRQGICRNCANELTRAYKARKRAKE
jgi:hypothetical protein